MHLLLSFVSDVLNDTVHIAEVTLCIYIREHLHEDLS